MANANKAKGTLFETKLVQFLRANVADHIPVFKPRQEGPRDFGDVHAGDDFVIQCKDHGSWSKQSLYDWLDAVDNQASAARRAWPVVAIKRRKGTRSSGSIDTTVIAMSLATFSEVLHDLQMGRDAIEQLEEEPETDDED